MKCLFVVVCRLNNTYSQFGIFVVLTANDITEFFYKLKVVFKLFTMGCITNCQFELNIYWTFYFLWFMLKKVRLFLFKFI